MSTASDLLDALLADTDDESLPSGFSVEDALNDKHDFDVESILSGTPSSANSAQKRSEESSASSPSTSPQGAATTPPKQQRAPSPVLSPVRSPSPIPAVPKVRSSVALFAPASSEFLGHSFLFYTAIQLL